MNAPITVASGLLSPAVASAAPGAAGCRRGATLGSLESLELELSLRGGCRAGGDATRRAQAGRHLQEHCSANCSN